MTFENIMSRMLANIPDDLDKREGSIIYNALSPAAVELSKAYLYISHMLDLAMVDTTEGEYMDRLFGAFGIYRSQPTPSICIMEVTWEGTPGDIPMGSRFTSGNLNYSVSEKISESQYHISCETLGEMGNSYTGSLSPIGNIEGLSGSKLSQVIIWGENIETDSSYRSRAQSVLSKTPSDGNAYQYYMWADEFEGVGRVRVKPQWAGSNSVKVCISDAHNQLPVQTLVEKFQEYLDPDSKGLGMGKAPIGAKVTVVSGTKKTINIKIEVKLSTGFETPEGLTTSVTDFLSSITFVKESISYMQLGSAILNLPSISDIRSMTINEVSGDVAIASEEIPTLDNLSVVVI